MSTDTILKIGNGGAGIVGFVQYMYNKFNEVTGKNYEFEWVTSDTEETLNGLEDGTLDIGWPYGIERVCEAYTQNERNWEKPRYIFRDHFMLVGPVENNAELPEPKNDHPHYANAGVYEMFEMIAGGENGTIFLTRNDLSATNILEREIFKKVLGHYPDVEEDDWYVPLEGADHYPDSALEVSNENGYYTLSDRGIWTWADEDKKSDLQVYCEGGDTSPSDILLNPCIAVVTKNAPAEAKEFVKWLYTDGQQYVEAYELNNDRLYSKAPERMSNICDSI